jgi:hypothetical protein
MVEAELPNALKTNGTARTDGRSGRPPAIEVHRLLRVPSDRISAVQAMSEQEEWLHTATADPAFWLNEIS